LIKIDKKLTLHGCYPTHILGLQGARGIEPPLRFSDAANGFEDRGTSGAIAPEYFENGIRQGMIE
jgi:hypothetical protein